MPDRTPSAVLRAVFYDIHAGDRLKLDAKSNVKPSGGGARDFRFSPDSQFLPVFEKMFPGREVKITHGRKVGRRERNVLTGFVKWKESFTGLSAQERQAEMVIWPANEERKGEARIGTIHSFGFSGLVLTDLPGKKSIFMLIHLADHSVRVWFTTETSIRTGNWDKRLKAFGIRWIEGGAKSGFIDLVANTEFANGGG